MWFYAAVLLPEYRGVTPPLAPHFRSPPFLVEIRLFHTCSPATPQLLVHLFALAEGFDLPCSPRSIPERRRSKVSFRKRGTHNHHTVMREQRPSGSPMSPACQEATSAPSNLSPYSLTTGTLRPTN